MIEVLAREAPINPFLFEDLDLDLILVRIVQVLSEEIPSYKGIS